MPPLVTDAGERALAPDMAAGFPAGRADGYCPINHRAVTAADLEVGRRSPEDEVTCSNLGMLLKRTTAGLAYTAKMISPNGLSLRSVVNVLEFGHVFRTLSGVAWRRAPTAGGGRGWGQPAARLGSGLEMASLSRIAASSGVIRLARTMVSPSAV